MENLQFFRNSNFQKRPIQQSVDERKYFFHPFIWFFKFLNHNTNNNNNLVIPTRPLFTRSIVTKLSTVTSTVFKTVTTMCVRSALLATPSNPKECKQYDEQDEVDLRLLINPTLVQLVFFNYPFSCKCYEVDHDKYNFRVK